MASERTYHGLTLAVARASPFSQPVDALVCPGTSKGGFPHGVARQILAGVGEKLARDALGVSPLPVGKSVALSGAPSNARLILYAPIVADEPFRPDAKMLDKALRAALSAARDARARTLAIPDVGTTSKGRVPLAETAQVTVAACKYVIDTSPTFTPFLRVTLLAADEEHEKALDEAVGKLPTR